MVATDTKRISIRGAAVIIEGEHDGSVRTVHMDVATHEGAPPSIHGHSIGRWEDGVLVIDTAHFAPHRVGSGIGLPSGAHKRLVERLTLAKDGKSLTYRYELTDPEFIAAHVIGEVVWAYRPDLEYAPAPCDLEVARRFVGRAMKQMQRENDGPPERFLYALPPDSIQHRCPLSQPQ